MTTEYLRMLIAAAPSIREVWLIGSRADHTARPNSDWDYLVFGTRLTLQALQSTPALKRQDVDVLVVYDGDAFEEPWGTDDHLKRGALSRWEWAMLGPERAMYRGTKPRDSDGFYVKVAVRQARRVFVK